MKVIKKIGILIYVLVDYLSAFMSWTLFYLYRKIYVEGSSFSFDILNHDKFLQGILIIPLVWLFIYFISGTYTDIYKKSRLTEISRTFMQVTFGTLGLFFLVILDDIIPNYKSYYFLFAALFILHFILTFGFRLLVLTFAKSQLQNGSIAYRTLLIGGNERAFKLYEEIINAPRPLGYNFLGFIALSNRKSRKLEKYLDKIGDLDNLSEVVERNKIDEVILAIESSDHPKLNTIINALAGKEVVIKIIPDMYDILSGSVKMNHVLGAVLIEIHPSLMPHWQKQIKRMLDIIVSALVLITLSPLYAFIAIRVRFSSAGPIFYKQERIGKNLKPFNILKFRSMFIDAEKNGPALSSTHDPRITKWGRIMRKWRLDEIPQFYNVLKGEMSLIGPRPERMHFINKIVSISPEYKHLLKVQPGLTSWGMVKYGYAENVNEMIERMKYDLLYIENMSLAIDFKIMIYTTLILLQGKGK